MVVGGHEFRVEQELADVTSKHRPDTGWVKVDAAGHEHRWCVNGVPEKPGRYDVHDHYSVPTLKRVVDGIGYWENGEPYEISHLECILCGEHVEPGYRADEFKQYIGGLKSYYIDGHPVSREEFERRFNEEADRQK